MASNKVFVAFYLAAAFLALLSLAAACLVHYISWFDGGLGTGIFEGNQTFYWSRYDDCLTESSWIFYVGACVFVSQILWIGYSVTFACNQMKGLNLFNNPPVMSPIMFILFTLIMASTIGWLFLWNKDDTVKFATLVVLLAALFSYASLTMSVYRLHQHYKMLVENGYSCEVWAIRVLVHNCLAALSTFLTMILFYNIAAVLYEDAGISNLDSCYINLGLTGLYAIVFFAVDLLSCTVTRWTYIAPYLVLLVFQGAVIMKNINAEGSEENVLLIVAGVLIGMTVTMLVVRIIMSVWRLWLMELREKQKNMTLRRTPREATGEGDAKSPTAQTSTGEPGQTTSILRKHHSASIMHRQGGPTTVNVDS